MMRVAFKYFTGTFATWETLFSKAADFATELGQERLISISQSFAHTRATVTVWYWSEQ